MYASALDFWGDNSYKELIQAILQQGAPESSGPNGGSLRDSEGGGYSRGSQFAPMDLPGGNQLPDWLRNPNLPPGMSEGSKTGLAIAENADWIGRGVGALTGLPGMTMLANALANNYMNSNVFQSNMQQRNSSTQSNIDNAIDRMLYGDVPESSTVENSDRNSGLNNPQAQQYSDPRRNNMTAFNFIWGRGK